MENNPIQQRMDGLVRDWTNAINLPSVKIVRIAAADDEYATIEDFFEYMLAINTNQEDLVFLLKSQFEDVETYSEHLLKEVEELVKTWNETEKPSGIVFEKIEWVADYNLVEKENKASLFIKNMNALANYLIPEKDVIMSLVLRMYFVEAKEADQWLGDALKCGMEEHLRIGICDKQSEPVFDNVKSIYSKEVHNIVPNLDMDGAMEELAAMGDPTQAENVYRKHLTRLMNAVKKRNGKKVEEEAKKCLEIASKNLKEDNNWLLQIVMVYTILYNEQLGNKNYERGIYFAGKAIESAFFCLGRVPQEAAFRLVGQTHLGRGGLYLISGKMKEANADYKVAAEHFKSCKDHLMHCESLRLYAETAENMGEKEDALEGYLTAFQLIDVMDQDLVKGSTFPMIIKALYSFSGRKQFLSDKKMEEKIVPIFGENWLEMINKFGTKDYIKYQLELV